MEKEALKAAIKANFENNEFSTAMELNKDLFQQYEVVAGKRSLSALVSAYRKKAEVAKSQEPSNEKEVAANEDGVVSTSPMMKQFEEMKKKYPEAILLFRCGDFYETYKEDAEQAAKVLGITLTKSTKQKEEDGKGLRMAGFPYHSLDTYLPKLIRAGKRVAICDQLEDPRKKIAVNAEAQESATPDKKEEAQQAYKFKLGKDLDLSEIKSVLDSENPALSLYCITMEEFEQVNDNERKIKTTMYVKPDGLGWEKASDVSQTLKDNDLKSFRKPGSFYNSECGLPVGEVYVKYTMYKVGEALQRFAFRTNTSAIRCATCL